uniref:Uncharacterized protein LOC100181498 n=1 Tax=Phallusia mammillata TaxID=59560 RepID=A0A6F9DHI1_9ASCI|nr:uncharacterized protein LOC100181498 [Phallusia mammillata]
MSNHGQNEFEFRLLTEDDLEVAVEFVHKNYTLKEPLRQMITKDVEQCIGMDQKRIVKKLKDNASIGVFNKSGKMIASAFSGLNTRAQKSLCCHGDHSSVQWFRYISTLVETLEGSLMDELNTDKFLMLSMLAVDPDYQRRGLAKELVKRSEDIARKLPCEYMVADASSFYTQKCFENMGYVKLKSVDYKDYFDPALNVVPKPPHLSCVVYYKKL